LQPSGRSRLSAMGTWKGRTRRPLAFEMNLSIERKIYCSSSRYDMIILEHSKGPIFEEYLQCYQFSTVSAEIKFMYSPSRIPISTPLDKFAIEIHAGATQRLTLTVRVSASPCTHVANTVYRSDCCCCHPQIIHLIMINRPVSLVL